MSEQNVCKVCGQPREAGTTDGRFCHSCANIDRRTRGRTRRQSAVRLCGCGGRLKPRCKLCDNCQKAHRKASRLSHYAAHAEQIRQVQRRWRKDNPDKVRENNRRWYSIPENRASSIVRARAATASWYKNHPEWSRAKSFRLRYGPLHAAWRHNQLALQNGRCLFCRRLESEIGTLHTDHDHRFSPRDPRGWRRLLCSICNRSYGGLCEDPEIIARALEAAHADALIPEPQAEVA